MAASPAFDPAAVSGTVVFSGWQASAEEGAALEAVLADFETAYPNITVDYQPVAGDYPAAMTAKFSAGEPPDLFYVDSSVAPEWIDEGVLEDLEPLAAERGFDTSAVLSRATSTRSRARTAASSASRRTAIRWRWPTTPTCSRLPASSRRPTGTELTAAADGPDHGRHRRRSA